MKTFILLSAFCIYWALAHDIGGDGHFKGFYNGDKQSDYKVKTRIIEKKIPVPYTVEKHVPYTVYKKVPYKVKVPVPQPYYVEKKIPYPVKEIVKVPYYVPKPYNVFKKIPYEVKVPVPRPVEVKVHVPKPYIVEKKVPRPIKVYVPQPYTVEKRVPYPVKVLVPVPQPYTVEKKVPYEVKVPVERPYIVHVPKPYPVHFEEHIPVEVEKPVPYEVKVPATEHSTPTPIPVKFPSNEEQNHPTHPPLNQLEHVVDRPVAAALTQTSPQEKWKGYKANYAQSPNTHQYNGFQGYQGKVQEEHEAFTLSTHLNVGSPHKPVPQEHFNSNEQYSQHNFPENYEQYGQQYPQLQSYEAQQNFVAQNQGYQGQMQVFTEADAQEKPYLSSMSAQMYGQNNAYNQIDNNGYYYALPTPNYGQVQNFPQQALANVHAFAQQNEAQSYGQQGLTYAQQGQNEMQSTAQADPQQGQNNAQQTNPQALALQGQTSGQKAQNNAQLAQTTAQSFPQQEQVSQTYGQQSNSQTQTGGQSTTVKQNQSKQTQNNAQQAQTNPQSFQQQEQISQTYGQQNNAQTKNPQSFQQQDQISQTYGQQNNAQIKTPQSFQQQEQISQTYGQQNNAQTNLAQNYNGQNTYSQEQQQQINQNNDVYFQQSIQQMQAGVLQSAYQQNNQDIRPTSNYSYHNHAGLGQFSDDNGNVPTFEALVQHANFNNPTAKSLAQQVVQQAQSEALQSTTEVPQRASTNSPQQITQSQQVETPQGYEQQYITPEEYQRYYGDNQQYYNAYENYEEGVVAEEPEQDYYYPQSVQQPEQPKQIQQPEQLQSQYVQYEQIYSKDTAANHKSQNNQVQQTNGHGPPKVVKYTNVVVHPKPQKPKQQSVGLESRIGVMEYNPQHQHMEVVHQMQHPQHKRGKSIHQKKSESVQIEKPRTYQVKTAQAGYETRYVPHEYGQDGVEFSDGVFIQANTKGFEEPVLMNPSKKHQKMKKTGKRVGKALNPEEGSWVSNGWTPIEQ